MGLSALHTYDSFSTTLPLVGGIAFGSGGTCHVTECVSIVDHCLNSAKPATGKY